MKRFGIAVLVGLVGLFVLVQATDFPFGAFVVYNNPNFAQMQNLGLNRLYSVVHDAASPVFVDSFKNAGFRVVAGNGIDPVVSGVHLIPGWPLLYSEALYNRWQAEQTTLVDGVNGVGMRHAVGRLEPGDTIWSADPALDPAAQIQSGPMYYQVRSWPRQAQCNGMLPSITDSTPDYTVAFRLRVDSVGGPPDTICKISVFVASWACSTYRETTKVYKILTTDSFTAGQFKNFTLNYNWEDWNWPNCSPPPPPRQSNQPNAVGVAAGNCSPYGSRSWAKFVNFNIDWYQKRKLYIDYTEVYDELGRRLFVEPDLRAAAIDSIKASASRLDSQTFSPGQPVVAAWYMADEPSSNDFFTPIHFVDSLIRSVDTAQFGIAVHSDPNFVQDFIRRAKPKVLAEDMYPFTSARSVDSNHNVQVAFDVQTSHLRTFNTEAKKAGIPFHFVAQAFGGGNYRDVTTRELLAESFLGLCYGSKGLFYWPYDEGNGYNGLVTSAGDTTHKYSIVKQKVKPFLDSLGNLLLQLNWDTAGPGKTASNSTHGLLNQITSDKYSTDSMFIEVGRFNGTAPDTFFMLVNRRTSDTVSQNVTVWLNKPQDSMYYVIDAFTGDTVLTGGVAGGAPFTAALAAGEGKLFKVVSYPQQYVHGTVKHVAWQGKITLDGDVTIPNGKVLKILYPKAQVRFLANRDTTHSGFSTSKAELVLYGGLLVTGVYGDTVKFISDATSPDDQDWYGITIIAGDPPDRLIPIDDPGGGGLAANGAFKSKYGLFKNAYVALDYQNTAPDTVKNCLFQNNFMYGVRSANDSLKILNSRFLDHPNYGVYLDAVVDTVKGCYFKNNAYSINAYRSYGLLSYDTILNASGYFGEVGLQVDGYESGHSAYLTMANCIDSGEFNQAALIAHNRVKIQDSYVKTRATSPIPDPAPQNIAILGLGGDTATVRHSTVKYSGYNSTIALIKATAAPLLDLGRTSSDSGRNTIIKGSGSNSKTKAVNNTVSNATLQAIRNWWGTADTTTIKGMLTGLVEFRPPLSSQPSMRVVAEEQESKLVPLQYSLGQNYPNPFNPTTTIRFSLPKAENVRFDIYNLLGQKIRTLVDEEKLPGAHQVIWDGRDGHGVLVSSGLYFYKIETASFKEVKRMVFLK